MERSVGRSTKGRRVGAVIDGGRGRTCRELSSAVGPALGQRTRERNTETGRDWTHLRNIQYTVGIRRFCVFTGERKGKTVFRY